MLGNQTSLIPELKKGLNLDVKFSSYSHFSSIHLRNKARLLTPEEGCGLSEVQTSRIVGGSPAKNGKQFFVHFIEKLFHASFFSNWNLGAWPWIALLGYRSGTGADFRCG